MKILVIRFSSIGDIVLTTPIVRCLKQQIKDVEVHYLTKDGFKSVLDKNPYIDFLHTIKNDLSEIIPTLKDTFDLVFIDADKREYVEYFKLISDKIPSGAYLIADNTLWGGKVLKKPAADDQQTKGIIDFNSFIKIISPKNPATKNCVPIIIVTNAI